MAEQMVPKRVDVRAATTGERKDTTMVAPQAAQRVHVRAAMTAERKEITMVAH